MSDYKKIVSFYIGERIYGVEMYFVQEFIEYISNTRLPKLCRMKLFSCNHSCGILL
jgi:chemotaxis signal transduction protein